MNIVLVTTLICLALAGALAVVLRRLTRTPELHLEGDWLAGLAADRYGPMERLLDPGEEEFLARNAGRAEVRRFRAHRRKIFRGYLRSLERDFGRMCAAIRLILVHSEQDRPELATALMKRQAMFAVAVLAVRGRLLLHASGIGTVDVRGLVGALDGLRAELGQLVPVASLSTA